MEKLNNIIKVMIVGIMAIVSIIIITVHIGIIPSISTIFILFVLLYILNKKHDIKAIEKQSSKKINIVLAVILFITALTIRILLVKLLQISPESDFALLINASKNLAVR